MKPVAAELVTTGRELAALREEWRSLWHRVPDATPFQSPEWLLPWWRQFGTRAPRIAVVRDADGLAGVLPLYILDRPDGRTLLPIGAGITDYQDALLSPRLPRDAASVLLRAVLREAASDGVTACELIDLPPGAALRDAARDAGWRATWRGADPCPVLALPERVDALRTRVPPATCRKLRMNRHRAERIGGSTTERATVDTAPALLDALFRLHEARWEGQGVLADPRVRAFHREAAPLLLENGALRLQVLRFGDRIVAAYYALLAGARRILFYLGGYDTDFAQQSPGNLLLGAMIEDAIREGRAEVHFLRGGERYKFAWGGDGSRNAACRMTPG